MTISKRIAALTMAAVMTVSMTGCSGEDTAWILQDGDNKIPAGIYILNVISAHNEATSKVADPQTDVLKQKIGDVEASKWISDRAVEISKEYVAIERKFTEFGLTLPEETKEYVTAMGDYEWGMYGKIYEKNGVAKESHAAVLDNSMKASFMFEHYYSEKGPAPIADEEYKTYFADNYSRSQFIRFAKEEEIMPSESEAATSSAATSSAATSSAATSSAATSSAATSSETAAPTAPKSTAMEQAEAVLKRLEGGADMFTIMEEGEKKALAEGEELHDHSDKSIHDTIVNKNASDVPAKYIENVFAMKDGEYKLFEDDTHVYVAKKLPLDPDGKTMPNYKGQMLSAIKGDEFNNLIKEWGTAVTDVKVNDATVKKFTADKISWQ